jgi:hypothetical protein
MPRGATVLDTGEGHIPWGGEIASIPTKRDFVPGGVVSARRVR